MELSEQRRRAVRRSLAVALGEQEADDLMAQLPTLEWNEVATKQSVGAEIRASEQRQQVLLREVEAALRGEMAELRADMTREMSRNARLQVYGTISAVVVTGGLAFAAAGLA